MHASGGGWRLRNGRDNWAFVGGRARDFVLRASQRIVTVNITGGSYDSSVVQGTTPYGETNCCLSKTQPRQPTRARTRAVGFVPRVSFARAVVPLA